MFYYEGLNIDGLCLVLFMENYDFITGILDVVMVCRVIMAQIFGLILNCFCPFSS